MESDGKESSYVPVNLIQHSLKSELAYGSYLFTDILKDGIVLYDNGRNADFPLVIPEVLIRRK